MPLAPADERAFKPCLIIPCFNHGRMMSGVLARIAAFGLPCFIIDDGSEPATQEILTALAATAAQVTLLRLPTNSGKGRAVMVGMAAAAERGFTHGVQIDADGQHQLEDIPEMLALARANPHRLISGLPQYDSSVPKSRLYGRYITHVWVWIETLSLSLKDSMCGFRVYPLRETLEIERQTALGSRMDFDTEVMVRLYWAGVKSEFLPTRVTYPVDGISHFDVWRDNLRITRMHTRLFFGMLPRIPRLLSDHFSTDSSVTHWSQTRERKGFWGMRIMLAIYSTLGRRVFNLCLYPVIGYFWLTGRQQRTASRQYLQQVTVYAEQQGVRVPENLTSFRHFMRFGEAMLDKLASWQGELKLGQQVLFPGADICQQHIDGGRGTLLLASHLGDIEICRALVQLSGQVKINALVFHEHGERFKQLMSQVNQDANLNLISVAHLGPDTAIMLRQKLDAGEWVAIVGDRTAVSGHQRGGGRRVIWSEFLGKPAPFPQGPFVLAAVLHCPVMLMVAIKQGGKLQIHCEPFADPLLLPRGHRQQALQQVVDRYAQRLAFYCLQAPLDWFNFFDFWRLSDDGKSPDKEC